MLSKVSNLHLHFVTILKSHRYYTDHIELLLAWLQVTKEIQKLLFFECLEVANVVVKTAFLNYLSVEIQEDKLCLEVIPFEKANSQAKYILIEFLGSHNL